jgi:hypothetical protein
MKKILMLALLFPMIAAASTVYSPISLADGSKRPRSVKAVATTGSEAAPSTAAEGMDLTMVGAVDVVVCADSGQTITLGATVQVWFYDVDTGLWALSDYSLSVPTGKRCATTIGPSAGKGIPDHRSPWTGRLRAVWADRERRRADALPPGDAGRGGR